MLNRSRRYPSVPQCQVFEPLEARTLFSLVLWDGGPTGNGFDMMQPVNWVGDVLPNAGDIARIATGGPALSIGASQTFACIALEIVPATGTRLVTINGTLSIGGPEDTVIGAGATLTAAGGDIEGLGAVKVQMGGALNLTSASDVRAGGQISNLGTLTVSGAGARVLRDITNNGLAQLSQLSLGGGAFFGNDLFGTTRLLGGSFVGLVSGQTLGTEAFLNAGLTESIGTATTFFNINVPFDNILGTLLSSVGTLVLNAGPSFNREGATMEAAPGATLVLNPFGTNASVTHEAGSTLIADGIIRLQNQHPVSSTTEHPTLWTGTGVLQVGPNGTADFQDPLTVQATTLRVENNGFIAGPGAASTNGTLELRDSARITGTAIVLPIGRLLITGSSLLMSGSGRLINQSLDPGNGWTPPVGTHQTWQFANGATFENQGKFTLAVKATTLARAFTVSTGTILNTGELILTSTGLPLITSAGITLDQRGTLRVQSGGLDADGPISQIVGSRLTAGDWRVTGPAFIDSTVKVGIVGAGAKVQFSSNADASRFLKNNGNVEVEFNGQLVLSQNNASTTGALAQRGALALGPASQYSAASIVLHPTSTTSFEIAGTSSVQNGRLAATGPATLGGAATISFSPGFTPANGNEFTLLTSSANGGIWSMTSLPDLSALGLQAALVYLPTLVKLIVQSAPSPLNTWVALGDATSWFNAANWSLGHAPMAGERVSIPDLPATPEVVFSNPGAPVEVRSVQAAESIRLALGILRVTGEEPSSLTSVIVEPGNRLDTDGPGPYAFTQADIAGALGGTSAAKVIHLTLRHGARLEGGDKQVSAGLAFAGGAPGGHSDYTIASDLTLNSILVTFTPGTHSVGLDSVAVALTGATTWTGDGILELYGVAGINTVNAGAHLTKQGVGTLDIAPSGIVQFVQIPGTTIDVQEGCISFRGGGNFGGTLTGAPVGEIHFDGATTLQSASRTLGQVQFRLDGGTTQLEGLHQGIGSLFIAAPAVLNVAQNQTFASPLTLDGRLAGSGVVVLAAPAIARPGARLNGPIEIGPGTELHLGGTAPSGPIIAGTAALTNRGVLRFSGQSANLDLNGVWTSTTGSRVELAPDADHTISGAGSFIIQSGATVEKTGSARTTFGLNASYDLRGITRVLGGTLRALNVPQTSGGTLADGDWHVLGDRAGIGILELDEPVSSIGAGAGVVIGDPAAQFTGLGASLTRVDGLLVLNGGAHLTAALPVTLGGSLLVEEASLILSRLTIEGDAGADFIQASIDIADDVLNAGSIATLDTSLDIGNDYIGTGGRLDFGGGTNSTLRVGRDLLLNGPAEFRMDTDVLLGEVGRDLTLNPLSELMLAFRNAQDFDRLHVLGTAHLAGTLSLAFDNGFKPQDASSFRLFSAATMNGAFATINVPTFGGNRAYTFIQNQAALWMQVAAVFADDI